MLLNDIDAFLEKSGMTATAFSKAAMGDPNFVRDLRAGREPRSRSVQKARDFMAAQGFSSPSISPGSEPAVASEGVQS